MKLKAETIQWAQRYQTALHKSLARSPWTSLPSALRLGGQAVTLGMETLAVARIHEQALLEHIK